MHTDHPNSFDLPSSRKEVGSGSGSDWTIDVVEEEFFEPANIHITVPIIYVLGLSWDFVRRLGFSPELDKGIQPYGNICN